MAIVQSIDSAREQRIGPHGVADGGVRTIALRRARRGARLAARAPCRRRLAAAAAAGEARRPRRHPRCRRQALGGRERHRVPRHRRIEPRRADAGAARRPRGARASARCATAPRLHFMDNLDPETYGALLGKLPLATTRFVAISKSGGTGETLMQTIAALAAVKAGPARIGAGPGAVPRPHRAGKGAASATACASCSCPDKVAMLDHDPGVGGRFSVLTNVGLLPAAIARPRHRRDPRRRRGGARAGARRKRPPPRCRPAVGAALAVALADASNGKPISVLMAYADRLERFTRWYVQLWAESLGKDGKGTTPIGGARAGRPAQPAAALHRRPARQAVHDRHRRRRRARPAHRRPISRSSPASRISPARPSAIWSPRRAAPPPRRWRRTAARCAPSISSGSTRRASASC